MALNLMIAGGLAKVVAVGGLMAGGAGAVYVVAKTTDPGGQTRLLASCGHADATELQDSRLGATPMLEVTQPPGVTPADAPSTPIPPGLLVPVLPASNFDTGVEFTMEIRQSADRPVMGVQTDVVFDPAVLQVVDVKPGAEYEGAIFLHGVAPTSAGDEPADIPFWPIADTIAVANQTGTLANLATFFVPGQGAVAPLDPSEISTAQPGEATALLVAFRVIGVDAASRIELTGAVMLGVTEELPVTGESTFVVVGEASPPETSTASPSPTMAVTATPSPQPEPECTETPEPVANETAATGDDTDDAESAETPAPLQAMTRTPQGRVGTETPYPSETATPVEPSTATETPAIPSLEALTETPELEGGSQDEATAAPVTVGAAE